MVKLCQTQKRHNDVYSTIRCNDNDLNNLSIQFFIIFFGVNFHIFFSTLFRFKLEHVASDSKKCDDAKPALYKLYERNHYTWDDDYTANSKLRAEFRTKKKELKLEADKDNALLAKSSLDIELLPENDQDIRLAAMMRLQSERVVNEKDRKEELINRPALPAIKAISSLRHQRLLNTKLTENNLGIKRKACEDNGDSTKRSKPTETVTRKILEEKSTEESSTSIESVNAEKNDAVIVHTTQTEQIRESSSNGLTKSVQPSLALICNYSSNSSSDDDDNVKD